MSKNKVTLSLKNPSTGPEVGDLLVLDDKPYMFISYLGIFAVVSLTNGYSFTASNELKTIIKDIDKAGFIKIISGSIVTLEVK